MSRKIVGVTVGSPLPKSNLRQEDPTKGDYVKGREDFVMKKDAPVLVVTSWMAATSHSYDEIVAAHNEGKHVVLILEKQFVLTYVKHDAEKGVAYFGGPVKYPTEIGWCEAHVQGKGIIGILRTGTYPDPSAEHNGKVLKVENGNATWAEEQDISGKLDSNKLPEAINTALAQAKESGEFDGYSGENGKSIYYMAQDGTSGTALIHKSLIPTGGRELQIGDFVLYRNGYLHKIVEFRSGSMVYMEKVALLRGKDGDDHVYVGSDTPPDTATIWIDPTGEPTSTDEWEFDMEDGTTEKKTVVVVK